MSAHVGLQGENLRRLTDAVRAEYWRRGPYESYAGGLLQPNTVRVVVCQLLEALGAAAQLAIVEDLYTLDSIELLRDDPREVFAAADSVASHIFDLVCEVVWQTLVADVEIRVEDEIREALAEGARDPDRSG
jgi:hypothetical protein